MFKATKFHIETERDWVEDFKHENGMYQNRCIHCNELFIGYKRRPFCKICGTKLLKHMYTWRTGVGKYIC